MPGSIFSLRLADSSGCNPARPSFGPSVQATASSTSRSRRAGADLGRQFAILVAEPDYCTRDPVRESDHWPVPATFEIPWRTTVRERARGAWTEESHMKPNV